MWTRTLPPFLTKVRMRRCKVGSIVSSDGLSSHKQASKKSPLTGWLVGVVIKRLVGSLRSFRMLLNNESREHSQRIR